MHGKCNRYGMDFYMVHEDDGLFFWNYCAHGGQRQQWIISFLGWKAIFMNHFTWSFEVRHVKKYKFIWMALQCQVAHWASLRKCYIVWCISICIGNTNWRAIRYNHHGLSASVSPSTGQHNFVSEATWCRFKAKGFTSWLNQWTCIVW